MTENFNQRFNPLNIAIIGAGISGMAAAWLLSRNHKVTVYEKEDRIGGHSNTINIQQQPIDTGFIVFNEFNYPNLTALFSHLNIATQATQMSFSVSINQGKFEFGSNNLFSLFGQRSNLFRFKFWQLLADIRKFFKDAIEFQNSETSTSLLTLGEFLERGGYEEYFVHKFILPMGAAIWSSRPGEIESQPAQTFIKFFFSHGLLHFNSPISWKTVTGGSREYIKKLTASYANSISLNCGVKSIKRIQDYIDVLDTQDATKRYDKVVIAVHADDALNILSDPDSQERELLSAFQYNNNEIILHSDRKLMPVRNSIWSSWNFLGDSEKGASVTYWMNLLQSIDINLPYFVSVNPATHPRDSLSYYSCHYEHPCFDVRAFKAQKKLWKLQGQRNTWFCGSYFGYGFHEDGLQSGLAVAEELGGALRPWKVAEQSNRIYTLESNHGIL